MKSWNVLRVLQVFCPTSDQTYGHRCECTALSALNAKCTSHWSVSGHLLVFHRRCWVVCCLLKVVEADITLHNGLIDINLTIYVHPCCHIVHLFLVGLLSSLRDWLLLPWRQADADCWWVVHLVLASTQQLTSVKPPKAHFELQPKSDFYI